MRNNDERIYKYYFNYLSLSLSQIVIFYYWDISYFKSRLFKQKTDLLTIKKKSINYYNTYYRNNSVYPDTVNAKVRLSSSEQLINKRIS